MGNNPVGKQVNTPKGKYLGKYLFTFDIRFLLEPYFDWTNLIVKEMTPQRDDVIKSCDDVLYDSLI